MNTTPRLFALGVSPLVPLSIPTPPTGPAGLHCCTVDPHISYYVILPIGCLLSPMSLTLYPLYCTQRTLHAQRSLHTLHAPHDVPNMIHPRLCCIHVELPMCHFCLVLALSWLLQVDTAEGGHHQAGMYYQKPLLHFIRIVRDSMTLSPRL